MEAIAVAALGGCKHHSNSINNTESPTVKADALTNSVS